MQKGKQPNFLYGQKTEKTFLQIRYTKGLYAYEQIQYTITLQ